MRLPPSLFISLSYSLYLSLSPIPSFAPGSTWARGARASGGGRGGREVKGRVSLSLTHAQSLTHYLFPSPTHSHSSSYSPSLSPTYSLSLSLLLTLLLPDQPGLEARARAAAAGGDARLRDEQATSALSVSPTHSLPPSLSLLLTLTVSPTHPLFLSYSLTLSLSYSLLCSRFHLGWCEHARRRRGGTVSDSIESHLPPSKLVYQDYLLPNQPGLEARARAAAAGGDARLRVEQATSACCIAADASRSASAAPACAGVAVHADPKRVTLFGSILVRKTAAPAQKTANLGFSCKD